MTALNAQEFSALCDAVFYTASSVASCTDRELERESLALRCKTTELCNAVLARKNDRLIARRRIALTRSSEVLARRSA